MSKRILGMVTVLVLAILLAGCGGGAKGEGTGGQSGADLSEQKNVARTALKDYFQISRDFSKGEFDSDQQFKRELKARYEKITTGQLLKDFYRFVDEGNIQSDYFISAFMQDVNCRVKDISITKNSPDAIEGEAAVTNKYEFSSMSDDLESPNFVKDNKVVNVTQDKFTGLVRRYNPVGINSNRREAFCFRLVREGGAWKFDKLDNIILETELTELQSWDGKKVDL